MLKILKEHTASVENQVKNREKMVDEMTKTRRENTRKRKT